MLVLPRVTSLCNFSEFLDTTSSVVENNLPTRQFLTNDSQTGTVTHLFPQFLDAVDDFARQAFVHHRLVRSHVQQDQNLQNSNQCTVRRMSEPRHIRAFTRNKNATHKKRVVHTNEKIFLDPLFSQSGSNRGRGVDPLWGKWPEMISDAQ